MHQRSISIFLALVLVGVAGAASAAYRWIDDNGQVQYTQTRPADRESEYIAPLRGPSAPPPSAMTGAETPPAITPQPAGAAASPEGQSREELQAAIDARNKDNCQRARVNLQVLSQPGRLRTKNADGQLVPMPENVRQQKIEQAQRQIEELCK